MNSKKLTVTILLGIVLVAFAFGMYNYQRRVQSSQEQKITQQEGRLVRMHSPVLGPQNAPVTIVEFFDPACETCRAFYPVVKDLLKKYPDDVRLVLRYAPFHQGSDKIAKLLEAAKRQNKYWPNLELAYKAAEQAGLDIQKALIDASTPAVDGVLKQDIEDLTAFEVTKTPTFFVNGRGLSSFGPDQLATLVAEEVAKIKK